MLRNYGKLFTSLILICKRDDFPWPPQKSLYGADKTFIDFCAMVLWYLRKKYQVIVKCIASSVYSPGTLKYENTS